MRLRIWTAFFLLIFCSVLILLFRPLTHNSQPQRINWKTDITTDSLCQFLEMEQILGSSFLLKTGFLILGLEHVKAGSYRIQPRESLWQLLRRFHGGRQTPVNLVLGNERERIRVPQQFASKMERMDYTRADSAEWYHFLSSDDSLRTIGLNHHNVLTRMMPLSYEVYWTESPRKILRMMDRAWERFWDTSKKKKAEQIGLNPTQVSILASIVEEETQYAPDRTLIASTYLNRLRIGMKLQADPTAKYASGDFQAKRVTEVHLRTVSPYNTYLISGLPPGPICLPSIASLEAVLNAPRTDYLYFVASPRFDGTSVFAKNYSEHLLNAKKYQVALRERLNQ